MPAISTESTSAAPASPADPADPASSAGTADPASSAGTADPTGPGSRPARPAAGARGRWIKRAVRILALSAVALLAGVSTLAYLAFLRSPSHSPQEFLDRGRGSGTNQVVVAAGASMTQASLSADWVGALRHRFTSAGYELVNAGNNGDTTADLLKRLDDDVVACDPDVVTLLVGTNDVLNDVPLAQFQANLTSIFDRLDAGTHARIAIFSLPPLGEDLDSARNRELARYNSVIEQTATGRGATYLPLNETLTALISQRDGTAPPYDFSFGLTFRIAFQRYVLRSDWDDIARGNDLRVLTDHVHLSDRGGAVVTDLVANWLDQSGR